MTQNLYDLNFEQLTDFIGSMGEKKYRAKQVWEWLYVHVAGSFDEMHNLPKPFRAKLAEVATLTPFTVTVQQQSKDRRTVKTLFQLPDGNYIETVQMGYDKRHTVCISTQAGCAMGCVFCATGQMGFMRNLTVGEIVGQVAFVARQLQTQKKRLSNVVFMGMGEPLHNYVNSLAAVDRLNDPTGLNIGARRITISTVGLVPAIRRFADEKRQTSLAISLHAATDGERDKLIPINRKYPIGELMSACHYAIEQTGRRLTFEWALIAGKNDTVQQAVLLGELLHGMLCHVNLIPLNPTGGYAGKPSSPQVVQAFVDELAKYGVSSTVRVRRGIDIQAGCGQLRDRVVATARE